MHFPGIYMRSGCRYNFYTAATGIENFTIFSRNVRTLEEAVNYHIALMQIKRAIEAAGGLERPFAGRLRAALAASPLPDDLRPSFYTVLTSARAFGTKKVRSPATIHLEEALEHHRRLTTARRQGRQALRSAWVQVMQAERCKKVGSRGNAIKRPRTGEEAEAIASAAERDADAWARSQGARAAARAAARLARQALLRRYRRRRSSRREVHAARQTAALRRLEALGERLLAAEARQEQAAAERRSRRTASGEAARAAARALRERRAKAEQQRARRRGWLQRYHWLRTRRTFEEEQRGPTRP